MAHPHSGVDGLTALAGRKRNDRVEIEFGDFRDFIDHSGQSQERGGILHNALLKRGKLDNAGTPQVYRGRLRREKPPPDQKPPA